MARIDYASWEERKFVTARLRLDAQNLRLRSNPVVLSPRNIIQYMFDYEKVLYLARAIALKGYFVNEMPIVVQEGGNYVVIEGNRRITACKVLLDPKLAPDKYQEHIQYLASTFNTESLRKMKCVIAPSRDDARVIIQNRHTGGSQIEKWDGMKQDMWYINDITRGSTVDEIAKIYLQSKGKVLSSILRYKLYAEAKQVAGLSDSAYRFVHSDERFPISTLWRFLSSKQGIEFLGLEYTAAGDIEILLPPEEYNKRFAAILEDLAKGSKEERAKAGKGNKEGINSRELNTEADIVRYVSGLAEGGRFDPSIVPRPADKDAIDVGKLSEDNSEESLDETTDFRFEDDSEEEDAAASAVPDAQPAAGDDVPPPATTKPKKARKATSPPPATSSPAPLISEAFSCQTTVPKIDEIFGELKTIALDKPNAIAVLFRTLMELLLTKYVEENQLDEALRTSQIQEYVTSNRKIEENLIRYLKTRHGIDETPEDIKRILKLREELPERWKPSLGFMLKYFNDHATELIAHPSIREAFQGYVRQQNTVTQSEFNLFVHNPFFIANPTVLQEFWSNFAPFITFLIKGITEKQDPTDAA
ncbi:hypothetical protein [Hymenobacter yonginensis]|uniref:ParB/Sulfiredoxin domain-containing protein n=1 Tax=Hymenobacter yonginensis TaxID=748197 RepID=A0ABY7PK51_9BACT|nr:hypothetical protein [Hymenobacter yonginensis]WBO83612.1 hypothetical protein O9Z63_14645 [Hymenobacter yonginensis]